MQSNGGNIVSQQLPKLLDVICCVRLPTLLHVVGCCCAKFETGQTRLFIQQLPTFLLFHDRWSVAQQFWIWPVCTALSTLLGPRTRTTHGLQSLMGCILPMMHCRSQRCWELLHPFAHHCQHALDNSQQCWELLHPFARSLKGSVTYPLSITRLTSTLVSNLPVAHNT